MRYLFSLVFLLLAFLLQAKPFISISEEARQKMLADPAKALLLKDAEIAMQDKALKPQDLKPQSERFAGGGTLVICHTVGRALDNWMKRLGWAYLITGDPKYAVKGVELLTSMAARFPLEQEFMSAPGTMAGGRGDMLHGLALGYGIFRDCMTPQQRANVAFCAQEYVEDFLREAEAPDVWWHNVHNFNGVCGGAAGLATLAFAEYPAIEKHQDHINKILNRYFSAGFDSQGACYEGTDYAAYGLEHVLLYAWLLKQNGGPDLFRHPMFSKLPRFFAAELLPGENVMDARNDTSYIHTGLECLFLAACNQDPLAAWLWNLSRQPGYPEKYLLPELPAPVAPKGLLPLDIRFPERGLCVWRTGWEKNDVMFSTEAGAYVPTTHNQADKGHFTLYAYGKRFAIDPGYANDRTFADSRGHTSSHNCVLIDGKGQAPSGCGDGTSGEIKSFFNDDLTGYALVDATKAYQRSDKGHEIGAGAKKALRHNLFVKPYDGAPAYAVVFDDMEMPDDQLHDFTWQMLTWPDMVFETRENGAIVQSLDEQFSQEYIVTPKDAPFGTAEWSFTIPESADWRIVLEAAALGDSQFSSDSFYVQLDNQPRFECHLPTTNGSWLCFPLCRDREKTPAIFPLSAGKHRIRVSTREPEAALRAIIITRQKEITKRKKELFQTAEILLKPEEARIFGGMTCKHFDTDTPARMLIHLSSEEHIKPAVVDLYAPADGRVPNAFERLRFTVRGYNPHFVALLIPLPGDFPEPKITETWKDFRLSLQIQWPTHADTISWNGTTKPTIKHE